MAAPTVGWLRRMLVTLECPFAEEGEALVTGPSLAKLVSWIEDRKIRAWEIEERAPLRSPDTLDAAFGRYLTEVECPYAWPAQRLECVGFLLAHAVACEHEDGRDGFRRDAAAFARTRGDAQQEDQAIAAICDVLGLDRTAYASPDDALLALCQAAASLRDARDGASRKLFFQQRPDLSLGFHTAHPDADDLAKVMRLFYLVDLKRLQLQINDVLVTAQHFVANPKTNTSLGKVGR